MYKKLIAGEFGLRDTFWKYGVMGTLLGLFVVKLFGSLLAPKLAGVSIYKYFTVYFNPLTMDTGIVVYTVCYLTSLFVFVAYNISMVLAVWRSAAAYERSPWLRHIAFDCLYLLPSHLLERKPDEKNICLFCAFVVVGVCRSRGIYAQTPPDARFEPHRNLRAGFPQMHSGDKHSLVK